MFENIDGRKALVAIAIVVGAALLMILMRHQSQTTAQNGLGPSSGANALVGGYGTAQTVYVPTTSYDINYTDSRNMSTTTVTTSTNTTTTEAVPTITASQPTPTSAPVIVTTPVQGVVPVTAPNNVRTGIPGVVSPGDRTPSNGKAFAYNSRTGSFQVVPSSYNASTGVSTLSNTFGDGTAVSSPITVQPNKN